MCQVRCSGSAPEQCSAVQSGTCGSQEPARSFPTLHFWHHRHLLSTTGQHHERCSPLARGCPLGAESRGQQQPTFARQLMSPPPPWRVRAVDAACSRRATTWSFVFCGALLLAVAVRLCVRVRPVLQQQPNVGMLQVCRWGAARA